MSKINFLKPDKSNLNTFLYTGSFLFFISIINIKIEYEKINFRTKKKGIILKL